MNQCLAVLVGVLLTVSAHSQSSKKEDDTGNANNAVYASLGGPSIYLSAIYERHMLIKPNYSLGVKGGVGSSFSAVLFPEELSFPIGIFFLYGSKKGHLDMSLSAVPYILQQYDNVRERSYKEARLLYVPSLAYRYQKRTGGFIGRAGISSVINRNRVSTTWTPWIDLSLGWAF